MALLVVAAPATPVQADGPADPTSGPTIIPSAQNDTSAPLTALARGPGNSGEHRTKPHKPIPGHDHTGSTAPSTSASSTAAPALLSLFDGVGNGFSGPSGTFSVNAAPPDTNGAVGPNHYVQIVNSDFAVFNKTGTVLFGPVPNSTVWSGFGGGCQTNNDGDPTVVTGAGVHAMGAGIRDPVSRGAARAARRRALDIDFSGEVRSCLRLRHVDELPFARPPPMLERGEDGDGA